VINHNPTSPKIFRAGTLTYTVGGLAALFFWLLWGDFCFTLMESVWSSILPLKIKELQAPNWVLGAIMVSIPSVLNALLNPVVSTASDHYRSRFGRRRPFMLVATPIISILLCLIGFSPDIGKWFYNIGVGGVTGWSLGAITVGVIAICVFLFRTAEIFVSTIFYYFFNDVVPQAVIARFLALFRVVGTGAGALYNYFIFPHALDHMRAIFIGVGLLYFCGFFLMCLIVKEGEYPPQEPLSPNAKSRFSLILAYVKECLHRKIHVLLYLHLMVWTLAGSCKVFEIFLTLSLGLTLQQIGTIVASVGVASALLAYPAGALADRYHPLRLMVGVKLTMVVVMPVNFIWLFTSYPPATNFWICIALSVINLPLSLIFQATHMPLYMRLFPRQKFGQFCSFTAMCQAAVGIVSGIVGGLYIDQMRRSFPDAIFGKDYCYRLIPAFSLFFISIGLVLLALVYKEWLACGDLASDEKEQPALKG